MGCKKVDEASKKGFVASTRSAVKELLGKEPGITYRESENGSDHWVTKSGHCAVESSVRFGHYTDPNLASLIVTVHPTWPHEDWRGRVVDAVKSYMAQNGFDVEERRSGGH